MKSVESWDSSAVMRCLRVSEKIQYPRTAERSQFVRRQAFDEVRILVGTIGKVDEARIDDTVEGLETLERKTPPPRYTVIYRLSG